METLDGKNSLHVTVGIAYQNVRQQHLTATSGDDSHGAVREQLQAGRSPSSRPRRTFVGTEKIIPPFYTNLKLATFKFEEMEADETVDVSLVAKPIDFVWFVMSCHERLPLFNGFYSQVINDPLPLTVIAYMDPISQPPTRNDVVLETMNRSLKVADETGMPYHTVTYDLAVATKAFSIQALKAPLFDRLIILLGHFHI